MDPVVHRVSQDDAPVGIRDRAGLWEGEPAGEVDPLLLGHGGFTP